MRQPSQLADIMLAGAETTEERLQRILLEARSLPADSRRARRWSNYFSQTVEGKRNR